MKFGSLVLKTRGESFFHCDKANGGCGHISHYADVPKGLDPTPGPISADAAEWINVTCQRCGKPVQAS